MIQGLVTFDAAARVVTFNRRYIEGRGMDHASLERVLGAYVEASRDVLPHLVDVQATRLLLVQGRDVRRRPQRL